MFLKDKTPVVTKMSRLNNLSRLHRDLKKVTSTTHHFGSGRGRSGQNSGMRLDQLPQDILESIGQIGKIGTKTLTTKALMMAENKRQACEKVLEKILGILGLINQGLAGEGYRAYYQNYASFLQDNPHINDQLQRLYQILVDNACFIAFGLPEKYKHLEYAFEILKTRDRGQTAGGDFLYRLFDAQYTNTAI